MTLFDPTLRMVVRVVVSLAMAQLGGPPVVGVTQVNRDLAGACRPGIALGGAKRRGHPVGLGGRGQVDHGLGQIQLRLGKAHELDGPGGRVGNQKAHRIGHADVFAGQDDQSAGDEPGVLADVEHPGQPVQTGIGIGAPDALDEGAGHVVVGIAAVTQRLGAQRRLGIGQHYTGTRTIARLLRCPTGGQGSRHLQTGQGMSTIPGGPVDQEVQRIIVGFDGLDGQPPFQEAPQRLGPQGLQSEQGGTRQQRGVDLEERVLGGGPDEHQQSGLHRRQEGVLLGLVEPMDLVEEQDGAHIAFTQTGFRRSHQFPDVLHAGVDGREFSKLLSGHPRDEPGQRRLTRSRRTPEDHRRQAVGLDQSPQGTSRAQKVLLTDDVVQPGRPQAVSQRRPASQAFGRRAGEEISGHGRTVPGSPVVWREGHSARGLFPGAYSAGGRTRRPNSSRCRPSMGVGALVNGSPPDWVLG